MEEEKGFVERQRDEWRSHLFRKPSRHWWAFALLALSLGMIYFGLGEGPRTGPVAFLPPLGVLEGMGAFFGSLAELMPDGQTTLAGILRLWAGLFVACGFALMVISGVPGV